MIEKKKIVAIVVTYNRKELLLECLRALLTQSVNEFDIFVIDNASTDGTADALKELIADERVQYYNTGSNIGGAGGFNFGLRRAYELDYDYYWLMDDDTIPTVSSLEKLLSAANYLQDDFGFLYSYAQWIDGSICYMNGPAHDPRFTTTQELEEHSLVPINRGTFVSFFTKKNVVEQVGLPIKDFFIWSDDTEYCNRICKSFRGYWVTDSIVVHKMKMNTEPNNIIDSPERLDRYYYSYRNRYYIARNEHKLGQYYFLLLKRVGRILISAKNYRIKRIAIMLKGAIDGISFMPAVEYVTESNSDSKENGIISE